MSERRSSGRGRRPAPPPREILASEVRAEDLPDVVRPGAAAVPQHDTTADPAVGPSGNAALVTGLASFVIEAGRPAAAPHRGSPREPGAGDRGPDREGGGARADRSRGRGPEGPDRSPRRDDPLRLRIGPGPGVRLRRPPRSSASAGPRESGRDLRRRAREAWRGGPPRGGRERGPTRPVARGRDGRRTTACDDERPVPPAGRAARRVETYGLPPEHRDLERWPGVSA